MKLLILSLVAVAAYAAVGDEKFEGLGETKSIAQEHAEGTMPDVEVIDHDVPEAVPIGASFDDAVFAEHVGSEYAEGYEEQTDVEPNVASGL